MVGGGQRRAPGGPGDRGLEIAGRVKEALEAGRAVVGLETAVLTHGLPPPRNLEAAEQMEEAVREAGAEPATIGLLDGRAVVGLSAGELERLAEADAPLKVSRRDLAAAAASRRPGGTTVAATLYLASRAGIGIVATGGIGGVHRGGESSLDVSADLVELARAPVAVVCSGAKAVLDLPRTLEVLETLGVPVVGFGTGELPAFYSASSGLPLPHRVDTPEEAARLIAAQRRLGLASGIVFAHPPPPEAALTAAEAERLVARAVAEAEAAGVVGRDLTPYLLERVASESGGRALAANLALLAANARLAARIAAAAAAPG